MRKYEERSDSRGGRSGGSRSNRRSGGSRFREYEDRGSRGSGRRSVEMHDTVCDECKKECQVPFRPTEGKPIYCNECFDKKGGSQGRGSSDQFEKINEKLDKIIKALKIKD